MVREEDHSDELKYGTVQQHQQQQQHADDSAADCWDPSVNQDEAIKAQEAKIEAEIAERNSLIGDRIPLDVLLNEYPEEDHVYRSKILDLKSIYGTMRKSRPDGNCFFRAFGFSLFHSLLNHDHEIQRMIDVANTVLQDLHSLGFSFTVDDFHDVFVESLNLLKLGQVRTAQQLLDRVFNEAAKSDYLVVFLRLITSSHLQKNAEFFQAFIEDGLSVKEFCSHEVEPMYKESDHIHVIAITTATGVGVRINYLDRGGSTDKINVHDFPEGVAHPQIHLLYRPGHYDVLYPTETGASVICHESAATDSRSESDVTSSTATATTTTAAPGNNTSSSSNGNANDSTCLNKVSSNPEIGTTADQQQPSQPQESPKQQLQISAAPTSATCRSLPEDVSSSSHFSSEGVSSSKNPRLDPAVSSSGRNEDSNEPSTTS